MPALRLGVLVEQSQNTASVPSSDDAEPVRHRSFHPYPIGLAGKVDHFGVAATKPLVTHPVPFQGLSLVIRGDMEK